jgi:hypothetical protein
MASDSDLQEGPAGLEAWRRGHHRREGVSAVGLIGILLCLVAFPLFPPARSSRGFLLFFMLLALHVAASVVYHEYALSASADSALYYFDRSGLRRSEVQLGTIFTIKFVQYAKAEIGGTYLDYFLIFQAFGFWGLLFLQRCLEHAAEYLGYGVIRAPYWLLFLPGLHFWPGAIGKDAPLFLAISLALWAAIHLSNRAIWFAAAVFIMLLFRPHIALLATAAFAGAIFFGRLSGPVTKVLLVTVALAALGIVAGTVQESLTVDVSNPASVGAYLERQQQNTKMIPGAADFQNSFVLMRLVSLLFRPLFFDARGAFGLITSLENLVYIFVIGFMILRWRDGVRLFRVELVFRFAFFFALAVMMLLTITYYNVGLGLRQKTMIMPALLTFFTGQWTLRRARLRAALQRAEPQELLLESPRESGRQASVLTMPPQG